MNGFVSIVGAGPGDPDLLTRKAAKRLAEADVVLYDALVSPEALALAPAAKLLYVGKRANRPSTRQDAIHRLMISCARRGRRVVRLKGGDPFVLGRGGEEALALVDAGIAFEIIPGVSSSISAPALAGIPVTHRGISSAFVVVSGHSSLAYAPVLGSLNPHSATIVVLMGLEKRADIASRLIVQGWRPWTPVGVLQGASTPESTTWTGTLQDLGSLEVDGRPGTIVFGDVVSLAATIAQRSPHVLSR